jgi:hypothetical protein
MVVGSNWRVRYWIWPGARHLDSSGCGSGREKHGLGFRVSWFRVYGLGFHGLGFRV